MKRIILLTLLINAVMFSSLSGIKLRVLKNPQPNMNEPEYVEIRKVRTLNPDLGNGVYLFKPFSLTTDGANIYIYDNLQARIIKLDRNLNHVCSYGRQGAGPGEFSGTGRSHPVYIKFGRDGLLYANDIRAQKIVVLDENLKFLKDIIRLPYVKGKPVVDSKGKKYFIDVSEDNTLDIVDDNKVKLHQFPVHSDYFSFIFSKPEIKAPENAVLFFLRQQISMDITEDSRLIIFFHSNSSLIISKNGQILQTKRLWPKDGFTHYIHDLAHIRKPNKNVYRNLFITFFMDEDESSAFYLQYGVNRQRNINTVYKFDENGNLIRVLFLRIKHPDLFSRFELKVHKHFYVVEDSNLSLFK